MKRSVKRSAAAAAALGALITLAACSSSGSGATSSSSAAADGVSAKDMAAIKSHLVSPGTITASTTGQNPPGTYIDSSTGDLTGYYIDVCKDVAAALGLKVKFDQVAFADQLTGIQSGRYDMSCTGVSRTSERLAAHDFQLTTGTMAAGSTIVFRKGENFTSLDSTAGKTGAVTANSPQGTDLQALLKSDGAGTTTVKSYPGYTEMALDLEAGRIDYFISAVTEASTYADASKGLTYLKTSSFDKLVVSDAVRNQETALDAAVNKVEAHMRADGELAKLQQKYFGQNLTSLSITGSGS
jgi:L-cystine transport system substrate-binding protein